MEHGHEKANPISVQKHLKGVDYPVDRDELVQHAQRQHAPQDIIEVLSHMPERRYESVKDVARGIGEYNRR